MTDTPSSDSNSLAAVEVPENTYVRCPLRGFDLVQASQCPTCTHFHGMGDRFPGRSDMIFPKRYVALCSAQPTQREILAISK